MVRAIISIPDKSLKRIDGIARKAKKSRAQIVREAVDLYIKNNDQQPTWKEIVHQTAGIWQHKKIDGVEYQRQLRAEWDR